MALGIYISVPFCRTKCSYCNFASDVFSKAVFERYVERVCADIGHARQTAIEMNGKFDPEVDSIYLGGGTPTVLESGQLARIFDAVRAQFVTSADAEVTVECAPGTLTPGVIEGLLRCGVNRVSLGVQSFVDREAAAVGRLHKRETVFDDLARLRAAGITNINIDLLAGLPHQTPESWETSLADAIATNAPHVSVYMLEVDEDSRLGRELIAGGTRYHAHFVPNDEAVADFYVVACEKLEASAIAQYEISNFARSGFESRHNLKYWTRQPYLGFGVDAHSMLSTAREGRDRQSHNREVHDQERHDQEGRNREKYDREGHDQEKHEREKHEREKHNREGHDFSRANHAYEKELGFSPCGPEAVRFATADSLEKFVAGASPQQTLISQHGALEESLFLGLRLTQGVDLHELSERFGAESVKAYQSPIAEFVENGLLERAGSTLRLTPRGRLLSNEVFQRFISPERVSV